MAVQIKKPGQSGIIAGQRTTVGNGLETDAAYVVRVVGDVADNNKLFQAIVRGTGSVSATVQIWATHDPVALTSPSTAAWIKLGSDVVIAAAASPQTGSLAVGVYPYSFYQVRVTAITGTGAQVTVYF